MDREDFIGYCSEQLKHLFSSTKNGKPDIRLKHRTEGLMQAGELLGAISRKESSELIEKIHYDVFGESTADRAKRKKLLTELKKSSPDEYFEIPAIERRK
jgi:hypothetical protein